MKRAPFDDGTEPTVVVDFGPASKKCKTGTGTGTGATIPLTASNVAAASSSSGVFAIGGGVPQSQSQSQQYSTALSANSVNNVGGGIVNVGGQGGQGGGGQGGGQGGGGSGQEYTHEERHHIEAEEEFVCAIRPVDASFPHSGGSQLFSSLLSTASIVAHDLDLRSTNSEFPYQPHNSFPPPAACVFESQMQMQSTNYPHQPQETNHTQNHGSQNQNHGNHPLQMYSSMSSISASATSLSIVPDRDRCQGQSNGYTEADRDRVLDDQPL